MKPVSGKRSSPGQAAEAAPGRLTLVGLGPGGIEHLTIGTLQRLGAGGRLFVRTRRHPAVADLEGMGFTFESMDDLYEAIPDYDTLYAKIAERLVAAALGQSEGAGAPHRKAGEQPAAADREVVYAVPGHPSVAELSVCRAVELARRHDIPVEILPGLSWLDAAWAELGIDPTGRPDLTVVDALSDAADFQPGRSYLISHVYHPLVAGTLKVRLMEAFPDEHPVVVFQAGGLRRGRRAEVPLHELDRLPWLDHLTSVYVAAISESAAGPTGAAGTKSGARTAGAVGAAGAPDDLPATPGQAAFPLDPLVEVMRELRSETGCPWDREQTHSSLKPYVIEEAYEVWDAIDEGDPEKLCEELGDLLLQVVFHAQLARESGAFDMNDVVREIVEKLIRRHPHVFGEVTVSGSGEVVTNWEKIKRGEKGARGRRSALDGIPRHLPALLTAQKMQGKAARTGFEWPTFKAAVDKVWEEARELREAYRHYLEAAEQAPAPDETRAQAGTGAPVAHDGGKVRARAAAAAREQVEEEVGDLLFAVVNVSRFLHVNAEVALRRTVVKFARRFQRMEEAARQQGKKLADFDLDQLLSLWAETKGR